MSLMVSVELESSLGGCVGVVVDCEVPELLGGVEVLDEAVPEVEGVVEGGVCVVLGAEDCVLGAAGGVVDAVALPESVGSADPLGAWAIALATAEPAAETPAFADSAVSLTADSASAAFAVASAAFSSTCFLTGATAAAMARGTARAGAACFSTYSMPPMTRDSVVFLRLKSLVAAPVSNSSLRPCPGVRFLGRS